MPNAKVKTARYFTFVYAALIILTFAVASFVYSLIKTTPVELEDIIIETSDNGTTAISPGGGMVPDGPPFAPNPTSPPPSE